MDSDEPRSGSKMSEETLTFHWADYLVFVLFLVFSALLGVIVAYRNRRKATTGEFLMAGRDMHWYPVALSMQASFLSAIFILGTPSELYLYGIPYVYLMISYFTGIQIASYMYLPIFHKLKLTSAYEVCSALQLHNILIQVQLRTVVSYQAEVGYQATQVRPCLGSNS